VNLTSARQPEWGFPLVRGADDETWQEGFGWTARYRPQTVVDNG